MYKHQKELLTNKHSHDDIHYRNDSDSTSKPAAIQPYQRPDEESPKRKLRMRRY